ncbi:hypothetical protein CLOM_g9427 [Closterium sp. NIES-68]|nr:hypothetical protein CLOM_g9427 [Closterium sp. NIES-68]
MIKSSSIPATNPHVPNGHLALQKRQFVVSPPVLSARHTGSRATPLGSTPASSFSTKKNVNCGGSRLGPVRCEAAPSPLPGGPIGGGGGGVGASDSLKRAAREFFSASQGHHGRHGGHGGHGGDHGLHPTTNSTHITAPHSAATPAAAPLDSRVEDAVAAHGGDYLAKDEDAAWSALIEGLASRQSAGRRNDPLSAAVLESNILPEIALCVDADGDVRVDVSAAEAMASPLSSSPSAAAADPSRSAPADRLILLRPDKNTGVDGMAGAATTTATAATATAGPAVVTAALVNGKSSKSPAVAPNSVIGPSSLSQSAAAGAGDAGSSGGMGGNDGNSSMRRGAVSSTSVTAGPLSATAVSTRDGSSTAAPDGAAAVRATVTTQQRAGGEQAGQQGLGIIPFLKGKNILITGATGFLAKALVEKILREQPDVGQLYLLIQPRGDTTAHHRLTSQVIPSAIFAHLKQRHGEGYEAFMGGKLTAVDGNIGEEHLGLSAVTMAALADKVDFIINSAATTDFDARYDVALNINTLGPRRLLAFAKQCRHLQLLLHVSTAYVNGKRKGRAMERAFTPGDTIAAEMLAPGPHSTPAAAAAAAAKAAAAAGIPALDVDGEVAFAHRERAAVEAAAVARGASKDEVAAAVNAHMSALGRARAQVFGWQDAYVLSKAMGEMALGEQCRGGECGEGDEDVGVVPVVVVRPSIVESALCEPMAGWMEGMRMADPILMAYGKGAMAGFLAYGVADIIPVDFVVNAIIAVAAGNAKLPPQGSNHSSPSSTSSPSGFHLPCVYHVTTSVANPLHVKTIADAATEHFAAKPMKQKDGSPIAVAPARVFRFPPLFLLDLWIRYQLPMLVMKLFPRKGTATARRTTIMMKTIESLMHFAKIYSPYTTYEAQFDSSNTEDLFAKMSLEEQQKFDFNVRNINWHNYMCNVHIPGLRKFVLKGRGSKDL